MTEIRSLTAAKLAASLAPFHNVNRSTLETPPIAVSSKSYNLPLVCKRTGITVGSLNLATVAGHLPVIGQWKESMVLHPLFSLAPSPLLHFSRNTWFRFCNFSIEEGADEHLTSKQEETLQVAALAMIYHLTEVRQDIPWLPTWREVSSHWSSLMAISYWKVYLDSRRFRFPSIHISRLEGGFSLKDYLQICWDVKKSYETNVNEKIELEKLRAAEIATIALRDEIAGARPTSIRQLWRWFIAVMPKRYKKDLETWMAEIFFAKGEEIRNFTIKDIDTFEEYFLCECPVGNSISHAFLQVLASKRKYLQEHFEAFEIIIPAAITEAKAAGTIPEQQPLLKDFTSKAQWMIANAKWKLAHTDLTKHMNAALDKQQQLSVKLATTPPVLTIREEEDETDEPPIDCLDALNEAETDSREQVEDEE